MNEDSLQSPQTCTDQEAEDLLHDLVKIHSPSGEEARAADYLSRWMSDHGYRAQVDNSGSAVGVIGEGEREIVLLGHIDTFPGELPVQRRGRKLYGRGAVDAKGPLAAFAVAATRVELPSDVRLVVIGATEEESASSRGARHALGQHSPEICIIGEPSGWDRVTLGYKGRLLMNWSWTGPLGHSAGPTLSPAEVAADTWQNVQRYAEEVNDGRGGRFSRLDPSLRSLNTFREGAYGRAEMLIGIRVPLGLTTAEVETQLQTLTGDAATQFHGHEEAYTAEKNNPIVRSFLGAIRAEDGGPRFVYKTGTSDMNVVGPVWRCPSLAYGPGDASLDHTPDEHIDLDEYQRAIRVLKEALQAYIDGDRKIRDSSV